MREGLPAGARPSTAAPAPDAKAPLLALHGVECEIAGNPVVHGVSLALAPGQLGCLLGPSGCGKTTLLRAISGFQPLRAGRIELRGELASEPGRAIPPERRGVGFVFQDGALFPHLDVARNVGFGLHALPRAERQARVASTLALLGLQDYAARQPHELSGGQQQRVALARALAPQPDLLLLDEPFSSLDAHLRAALRQELRRLLRSLGIAALLVTHDQDEAFAFADRIGVMHAGRIEQWETPFDLYHRPATPFVARFVGEGRFLRARVLDAARLETTLGELRPASALAWPAGTEVQVLIRPDDVQPGGADGIVAQVAAAEFRGAEILYTFRLADGEEVSALFPSHQLHAPGEAVPVRLDLEHVVVFGPEPAG